MMMYLPRAAAMPPISALPYPLADTGTTRTPRLRAISGDPSVLPLSAITISPAMWFSFKALLAFSMQTASVSASSRHGITIETSTDSGGAGSGPASLPRTAAPVRGLVMRLSSGFDRVSQQSFLPPEAMATPDKGGDGRVEVAAPPLLILKRPYNRRPIHIVHEHLAAGTNRLPQFMKADCD